MEMQAQTGSRIERPHLPAFIGWGAQVPAAILQTAIGLMPLAVIRLILPLLRNEVRPATWISRLRRSAIAFVAGLSALPVLLLITSLIALILLELLRCTYLLGAGHSFSSIIESHQLVELCAWALGIGIAALWIADLYFWKIHEELAPHTFKPLRVVLRIRCAVVGFIARVTGTVFLLGLSLLPLSSLLLVLPAILPQESILAESTRPTTSLLGRFLRRAFALFTGLALFLALLASATELVTLMHLRDPYFGQLARTILPTELSDRLPSAMVDQWPYVLLVVYATDLLVLLAIGKVPLQYNVRNLIVRWKITLLTGATFTLVVGLLTGMFAYINGLNEITVSSGNPGNIFTLSDGATDELFSNLGYGEVSKVELESTAVDRFGAPLPQRVSIKEVPGPLGRPVKLCSKETYFTITQPLADKPGEKPRSKFVQLRGVEDAWIAGKVRNIELLEGEWKTESIDIGDNRSAWQALVGEGAAATYGAAQGKDRLRVGDLFKIGSKDLIVAGVMKSEGSTFSSETWVKQGLAGLEFGKKQFTTLVLRVSDESPQGADALAFHLRTNFTTPRLKAVPEPEYFKDLGKSNQQMMSVVVIIAIIMAIGGVFGVMNTMFAAIAQRTRDIGVLRVIGFKRWQILVSFMLESLFIALIGGVLGCALGSLADGWSVTSNLSAGQGSFKTVVARMVVDSNIIILGILFTIVMGRLGGLVPALSAMRKGILDSLK